MESHRLWWIVWSIWTLPLLTAAARIDSKRLAQADQGRIDEAENKSAGGDGAQGGASRVQDTVSNGEDHQLIKLSPTMGLHAEWLAEKPKESFDDADAKRCDLCPAGQTDSRECKNMFLAWITAVSFYNAAVPGVPIDLTICCPCMTMRFIAGSPDLTAIGKEEVRTIFDLSDEGEAMQMVNQFRLANTMRVYKETCQYQFGARHTVGVKTGVHWLGPEVKKHARTFARNTGLKEVKKTVGESFRKLTRTVTTDQKCVAMEYVRPSLSYFWAEELFTQACPTIVPYTVQVVLRDYSSEANDGFQIDPLQRKMLYDFLKQNNLLQEMREKDKQGAGIYLIERLQEYSKFIDTWDAGEKVFGEHGPVDEQGMLRLDRWQAKDGTPVWDAKGLKGFDKLSEDLQKLQERHRNHPEKPTKNIATLRRHLRAFSKLEKKIMESGIDANRSWPDPLLRTLDPMGLLQLRNDEQLKGLKLVGFDMPGMAEQSSTLYATCSTMLYGGVIAYAAVGMGVKVGGWLGATIGTATLPVIGTVTLSTAGALIGGAVGMGVGFTRSVLAESSQGTLILQGWRVIAGETLSSHIDEHDHREFLMPYMEANCGLRKNTRGHVVPYHKIFNPPATADKDDNAPEFWKETVLLMGVIRELYFERRHIETDSAALRSRAARHDWLLSIAGKVAQFQEDYGINIQDHLRKQLTSATAYALKGDFVTGERVRLHEFIDANGEPINDETGVLGDFLLDKGQWVLNSDTGYDYLVMAGSLMKETADEAKDDGLEVDQLLGDLPDHCWAKGVGPALRKAYDTIVGSNGRGAVCKIFSTFLDISMGGMTVLLIDPFRSVLHWATDGFRPPTFWYEDTWRAKASITSETLLSNLRKGAKAAELRVNVSQREYTMPAAEGRIKKAAIFAYLVPLDGNQFWRGPRVGVATPGEKLRYSDIALSRAATPYLRTDLGWLAPCREVYVPLKWNFFRAKDRRVNRERCEAQLAGNMELLELYRSQVKSKPADIDEEEEDEGEHDEEEDEGAHEEDEEEAGGPEAAQSI